MNRREFVTCAVCAGLATTVGRVTALAAEDGAITVGGTIRQPQGFLRNGTALRHTFAEPLRYQANAARAFRAPQQSHRVQYEDRGAGAFPHHP